MSTPKLSFIGLTLLFSTGCNLDSVRVKKSFKYMKNCPDASRKPAPTTLTNAAAKNLSIKDPKVDATEEVATKDPTQNKNLHNNNNDNTNNSDSGSRYVPSTTIKVGSSTKQSDPYSSNTENNSKSTANHPMENSNISSSLSQEPEQKKANRPSSRTRESSVNNNQPTRHRRSKSMDALKSKSKKKEQDGLSLAPPEEYNKENKMYDTATEMPKKGIKKVMHCCKKGLNKIRKRTKTN